MIVRMIRLSFIVSVLFAPATGFVQPKQPFVRVRSTVGLSRDHPSTRSTRGGDRGDCGLSPPQRDALLLRIQSAQSENEVDDAIGAALSMGATSVPWDLYEAAAAGGKPNAVRLVRAMVASDHRPSKRALLGALRSSSRGKDWKACLDVFGMLEKRGLVDSAQTFAFAMGACVKGRRPERAMELFRQMLAAGVTPNVVTFNSAIAACDRLGDYETALDLLAEMEVCHEYIVKHRLSFVEDHFPMDLIPCWFLVRMMPLRRA